MPIILTCVIAVGANEVKNDFVSGWEVRTRKGAVIPLTGVLANHVRFEDDMLILSGGVKQPREPILGRCIAARNAGDSNLYTSDFFEIGVKCEDDGTGMR